MDQKFQNQEQPVVCYEGVHNSSSALEEAKLSLETQPLNTVEDGENKITAGYDLGCSESPYSKPTSRMPIVKLWLVLILTCGFASVLLVASHLTHSLTLRVEAYHAIYNLMALAGGLFTIKVSDRPSSIKNTFGWARIELLSCLVTLLFITSLCFSVALESIQTAAHVGHQDPMHHPLHVIGLGGIGLLLNAVVYLLIGGYTHHQGCFLEHRSSGVWAQTRVPEDAVQAGMRALLSTPFRQQPSTKGTLNRSYQGFKGIVRDICGLVVVMICASVVLWDTRATLALYIDPGFAIISASVLLFLSYPFGRECCQILLQTIPGNIDVQTLSAKLLDEFPEVVNVHHLHIWSLTPGKVVATAHVVFSNPKVYRQSVHALEQFFIDKEITQVTLQPEFVHYASTLPSEVGSNECLLRCTNNLCHQKECCDGCQTIIPEETEFDLVQDELPAETNLQYRLNVQSTRSSRTSSNLSMHHGTSAYRMATINLPVSLNPGRRSRSKDDLDQRRETKSIIFRSYSCNVALSEQNELLMNSELKT